MLSNTAETIVNMRKQVRLIRLPSRTLTKARFPFKRNRLRCMRCVNENRKKRKRLRWQAANLGFRLRLLRENFTQQTQAPANRNARSKQWQP